MKTKVKRFISLISVCLVLITILSSCSFSSPEDTINLFIENLNALDIEGMFVCFEPRFAKQLQSAYNFGNGISKILTGMDIDTKSLAQLIPLFSGIDLGDGSKMYWPSWEATDYKTTVDKDSAEIRAKIVVTTGEKVENYITNFEMVKIDGEWYIKKIR